MGKAKPSPSPNPGSSPGGGAALLVVHGGGAMPGDAGGSEEVAGCGDEVAGGGGEEVAVGGGEEVAVGGVGADSDGAGADGSGAAAAVADAGAVGTCAGAAGGDARIGSGGTAAADNGEEEEVAGVDAEVAGGVVGGAAGGEEVSQVLGCSAIVPADGAALSDGLNQGEGEHEHEGMDSSWIPDGMDPSSTYLLEVRIMGQSCRPEFPGGFSFKWPIDADVTNFKDFLGDICEKYPWGSNETVYLHYIHASTKELIPICKDQDLTSMFGGQVVITLGNQNNLSQAIVPCTPSHSVPSQAFFTQQGSTSQPSNYDAYLENPFPHMSITDDSSSKSDDSSSGSGDSIAETDNVPEVEGGDDMSITDKFNEHMASIGELKPEAISYLKTHHKRKLKRKSKPKTTSAATENSDPTTMSSQVLPSLSSCNNITNLHYSILSVVGGTSSDAGLESNNQPLSSLPSSMAIVPVVQATAAVAKGKGKGKKNGKVKGSGKKDEKKDKDKKLKRKPSSTVQASTPPAKRKKDNKVQQNSPAMGTRSKQSSPSMGTRSKRKIID
uniref:Uncharacterized protein n=1 Tax=Oryza punctata TaxID=4537 RepID=A0A0E0LR64_ORYPU